MESVKGILSKKVEFVHQVQIFLGVLSSVLNCEDGVCRGSRQLSGEFCDDAARGFAGNRADAGYFMQMQAGHAGVACQVMLGVSRKNERNSATGSEMQGCEVEDFPVGEACGGVSGIVSSFFGSLKGVVEIWRVGEYQVVTFAAVR